MKKLADAARARARRDATGHRIAIDKSVSPRRPEPPPNSAALGRAIAAASAGARSDRTAPRARGTKTLGSTASARRRRARRAVIEPVVGVKRRRRRRSRRATSRCATRARRSASWARGLRHFARPLEVARQQQLEQETVAARSSARRARTRETPRGVKGSGSRAAGSPRSARALRVPVGRARAREAKAARERTHARAREAARGRPRTRRSARATAAAGSRRRSRAPWRSARTRRSCRARSRKRPSLALAELGRAARCRARGASTPAANIDARAAGSRTTLTKKTARAPARRRRRAAAPAAATARRGRCGRA